MSRNTLAHTTSPAPAVRVVHYVNPATRRDDMLAYDPHAYRAVLAKRRHEEQVLYARWLLRREEIQASDRKTRRFFLGFGAVVAVVVLGGLAAGGWLAYRALGHAAPVGLLAVPLILLGLVAVAGAGHRCVTVIQHWHQ